MIKSDKKVLNQYAYEYLKTNILSDKFNYDQIYSETQLAKEIGVSRTPIRDALHRLSQEKLIDILPSKGFTLHKLTSDDVVDVFQIRAAIEGFCTLLLAKEFDTKKGIDTISKLENILSAQENVFYTTKDIPKFTEYDTLFHSTIVNFANNTEFNHMFNNYIYRIKKLALNSLSYPNRMESALKEHYDILHCIKSGNSDEIYNKTITHLNSSVFYLSFTKNSR